MWVPIEAVPSVTLGGTCHSHPSVNIRACSNVIGGARLLDKSPTFPVIDAAHGIDDPRVSVRANSNPEGATRNLEPPIPLTFPDAIATRLGVDANDPYRPASAAPDICR